MKNYKKILFLFLLSGCQVVEHPEDAVFKVVWGEKYSVSCAEKTKMERSCLNIYSQSRSQCVDTAPMSNPNPSGWNTSTSE
jgi:hypothetical protein